VARPRIRLRASVYALAAGALATPALLLRSAPGTTPWDLRTLLVSLAQSDAPLPSTFTRCNQRRSCFLAVATRRRSVCSDLYLTPEGKFGSIQSFGPMPPAEILVEDLRRDLEMHGSGAGSGTPSGPSSRCSGALLMAYSPADRDGDSDGDLPYAHNRVELVSTGGDGAPALAFRYHISENEAARIAAFRRHVRRILAKYRPMLLKQAENNQRLAHVCGTCRFGEDPATEACWIRTTGPTTCRTSMSSMRHSSPRVAGNQSSAHHCWPMQCRVADHLIRTERWSPGRD